MYLKIIENATFNFNLKKFDDCFDQLKNNNIITNEDEFAEYLAKRYSFKTRYEVIEKYYITQ